MTTEKDIFQQAQEVIAAGDADAAVQLAKQELDQGIDGIELLNKGFIAGINKVGDLFGEGQLFLPELIMSATAMQGVIEIINAALEKKGQKQSRGKVVIGTVEGDLHDIGKTIVVSLLRAKMSSTKRWKAVRRSKRNSS